MSRGFTLLEVLIAVILFAAGFTAVVGLLSMGLVSSLDTENTSIAVNLAQQRIEEIMNMTYDSIVAEIKAVVSGYPAFQRQVAVSEPLTDLKMVTVTVYWTFKGSEVSTPLITYISKN